MRIGILGTGHIGQTLVLKLSAAGHEVKVANSRGPETIGPDILASGGRAVTSAEAMKDVDVAVLSVPLNCVPNIAPLTAHLGPDTVVVDTSNYYPERDGHIDAIDSGQAESLWVALELDRPVVKAWNAIGSDSLSRLGTPAGSPDRLAIPVAADSEQDRRVGLTLVEDTGFDAVDAGTLSESWRQQPGTPCYCTDLTREEMPAALSAADPSRSPKRRDIAFAAVMERMNGSGARDPGADFLVRLNRTLFM